MRTTISIDDRLLDLVRQRAAEQRKTVSEVIEDSVRAAMLRRDEQRKSFRVRVFDGGGHQPGVDLDDNAALLALMDESR